MSSKRQKRISASAEEYADQISRLSVLQSIRAKPDDDLFTVDRSGSQSSRRRIAKEVRIKTTDKTGVESIVSVVERKLVKRIVARGPKEARVNESEAELCDIWDADVSAVPVDANVLTRSRKSRSENLLSAKINVAIKGQSYNPSHNDHQNALAEALAVEIRKREYDLKNKGVWDCSVSEFTQSIIKDDSGSEDEDDEEEEGAVTNSKRKREKLTRAQLNKKKARNIASYEESRKKEERDLLKSLDALPRVIKGIEAEEKRLDDLKILREEQKRDTSEKDAMSYEEAALVPLSDELRGSLRKITPKGCSIRDQARTMRTTGSLMSNTRRKRKTFEKPHGSKNIKWFAKYKYV